MKCWGLTKDNAQPSRLTSAMAGKADNTDGQNMNIATLNSELGTSCASSKIYNFESRKLEVTIPEWPRIRPKVRQRSLLTKLLNLFRSRRRTGKLQQMRLKGM